MYFWSPRTAKPLNIGHEVKYSLASLKPSPILSPLASCNEPWQWLEQERGRKLALNRHRKNERKERENEVIGET